MSHLALMNAVQPDQQAQIRSLRQELADRDAQLAEAEKKIALLDTELASALRKARTVERGVQHLRTFLAPLYRAMGEIFGEIDEMGLPDTPQTAPAEEPTALRRTSEAWESWKKKLAGTPAAIIDLLMVHGALNHEQLRIHVGTNRKQTIYDAVTKLNKAGLLNKNGDKFSLKEL